MSKSQDLPKEGDPAPHFSADTKRGRIHFPEYATGHWCILFAHPANFTSAWMMFNTFMMLKEAWFHDRNTKLIGIANDAMRQDNWSDRVRRYVDIYLKAPLIEDHDQAISKLFGFSAGRKIHSDHNRVAFIIDPEGIIRLVIERPIDGIESTIKRLESELNRLQGRVELTNPISRMQQRNEETIDSTPENLLQPYMSSQDVFHLN